MSTRTRLVVPFVIAGCWLCTLSPGQDRPEAVPGPDRSGFSNPLIAADPALPTGAPGESITAIENAVLDAHDAMIVATEALDFPRLEALLLNTNRGALITDGRVTLSRDDAVATIRRECESLRGLHYGFARRLVTLLSPTSAMIVAEGTITAHTAEGVTFTRPVAQTIIFMRADAGWRVIHMHSSSPAGSLDG